MPRGKRHRHINTLVVADVDLVDQTQFINVDRDLWVVDLADCLDDPSFQQLRSNTLVGSSDCVAWVAGSVGGKGTGPDAASETADSVDSVMVCLKDSTRPVGTTGRWTGRPGVAVGSFMMSTVTAGAVGTRRLSIGQIVPSDRKPWGPQTLISASPLYASTEPRRRLDWTAVASTDQR